MSMTVDIRPLTQSISSETSSTFVGSLRSFLSTIFQPFQRDYDQWPWSQIGSFVFVCIGSYAVYKYVPGPYRRYYMSSTKNFSTRYNEMLNTEKRELFDQLKNIRPRDDRKRLQVVEIGAAHGANMAYYPPNLVELICVEPIRDFDIYLTQSLRLNPRVKCRELLVGNAENISVIRDNQVDAVVSTLTLSACSDIDQVLREIRRILKPDGIFIYMENIRSTNALISIVQYLCSPVYKFLFGISLVRDIPKHIQQGHFKDVKQKTFVARGIPFLLRPHVTGFARK